MSKCDPAKIIVSRDKKIKFDLMWITYLPFKSENGNHIYAKIFE